ncbi:MAG TPA: CocE/NonD family hydrolase [Steroidobacteraceae bacterium]
MLAQELDLRLPASATDPSVPALMRDLAERVLPVYQDSNRERYLANLSALQLVSDGFAAADSTRQELRDWRRSAHGIYPADRSVVYDIYVHARALEDSQHLTFAQALTQAFQAVVPQLDDATAYAVSWGFEAPPPEPPAALQMEFDRLRPMGSITLDDAVRLVWEYFSFNAYRSLRPLVDSMVQADENRRYTIQDNVQIKTRQGALLSAMVVRPKNASAPLPALLEYTIYVYPQNDAMECAAHGYVGVVAYARGKRGSPDRIVPFEYDGEDARAVIDWIAHQSWSDGRVGMYGSSYSAFAAWAAAKRPPAALKAIAASATTAPGIDLPREGGIYHNSAYRWARFVTDNNTLDEDIYRDDTRWRTLDQKWYSSGQSYWDLMNVYGQPDANFRRWLGHPSYDLYWQKMVPFRQDFSHINIPVLATTGYFDSNASGTLHFFDEHYRFNPKADQTLLVGPYDDVAVQRGALPAIEGYQVDTAALIDLHDLRYQWFDHVLKGAATPALLKDRVNFEVMGANVWQHAGSIASMANGSMRLYFDPTLVNDNYGLAAKMSTESAAIRQTVDFADRSDAGWLPSPALISKDLPLHDAIALVSQPLAQPLQVNGRLSGLLDFTPNKMDLDLTLALYEQLPSGEYLRLYDPVYALRASYARDRIHRHLLKAGERQKLAVSSERLTSRQLQPGSRLVLVLGVDKRADHQLNYGTGDDVSDESVGDATEALKLRWYASSYIDIPVRR